MNATGGSIGNSEREGEEESSGQSKTRALCYQTRPHTHTPQLSHARSSDTQTWGRGPKNQLARWKCETKSERVHTAATPEEAGGKLRGVRRRRARQGRDEEGDRHFVCLGHTEHLGASRQDKLRRSPVVSRSRRGTKKARPR